MHFAGSLGGINREEAAEGLGHGGGHGDAAVSQDVLILLFDMIAKPFEAAVAEDELQASHVLVAAVAVDVEDPDDGFDAADDVVGGDELVKDARLAGQRAETAGNGHTEAFDSIDDHGSKADVIDGGGDAILGAAR